MLTFSAQRLIVGSGERGGGGGGDDQEGNYHSPEVDETASETKNVVDCIFE